MVITRVRIRVALLVSLVIVLTGCMEALKTDGLNDPQRSSSWPGVKDSPVSLPPKGEGFATSATLMRSTQEGAGSPTAPALPSPSVNGQAPPTATGAALPPTLPPNLTATAGMPVPTPTPTLTALPSPTATPEVVIVLPTPPTLNPQDRWREQQYNRVAFETLKPYQTTGSNLWWYDPINQQHVSLGSFSGDFLVQATFTLTLNSEPVEALEVPYQVNQSYGLQTLSPALLDRIKAAGYGEWIDTYVIHTSAVSQQ